jgi:hypothetical protein
MKLALVAVILCLLASGCKKEKKDAAKTDEKAEGSGSAAEVKPPAPAPEAAAAVRGFAALAATETAGKAAGSMGGGGGGGIGGALGGIFGGGRAAEAAPSAPSNDTKAPEGEQMAAPSEGPDFNIEFPPAGEKGGDCAAVTDRVMVIVTRMVDKEMAKLPDDQRAMAEGVLKEQYAEMRKQFLTMCADQKWSQDLKDCILLATDGTALQACDQYAPKDTGTTAAEPAAEPVAAPEYKGGDECSDVAARMRELTLLQVGTVPPEAQAEIDKALDEQAAQIAEMCKSGEWSQEWRHCVSHAATMDAASQCFGS